MDLIKAIRGRKNIRAFRPDPIPGEQVEEILKLSIHAPSAINLRPWEFVGYRIAQKLDVHVPEFKVVRIGESSKRNYFGHQKDEEVEVRAGLATACKMCQDPSLCNYSSGEFLL